MNLKRILWHTFLLYAILSMVGIAFHFIYPSVVRTHLEKIVVAALFIVVAAIVVIFFAILSAKHNAQLKKQALQSIVCAWLFCCVINLLAMIIFIGFPTRLWIVWFSSSMILWLFVCIGMLIGIPFRNKEV